MAMFDDAKKPQRPPAPPRYPRKHASFKSQLYSAVLLYRSPIAEFNDLHTRLVLVLVNLIACSRTIVKAAGSGRER
jgi:hypothetical protein